VSARGEILVAQILEHPEDDAPRRVYADWLEEQGDPFCEVIRLQCDGGTDARVADLVATHGAAWLEPLAPWVSENRPPFTRGMWSLLYGGAGAYAQAATQKRLLAALKRIPAMTTMITGTSKRFAKCESLAWTSELHWWGCQLDDAGMTALAECPHVARLARLTLEKTRCSNQGLAALARSPHLARLRHLGLPAPVHMGNFDAAGVIELLEHLAITSLDLCDLNRVTPGTLGNASAATKLTRLRIHASRGMGGLASSQALTNLTELHIEWLTPTFDALDELLENPAFARLEKLTIDTYATPVPAATEQRLRDRFGPLP
jgi:uncharacterized protein (TIGR02996 family)